VVTARVDLDLVRRALRPTAILDAYGIRYRRQGRELRTKTCPACGQRNRDAVAIHVDTGQWCCHRCTESGDVFAMLAGYAGLDIKRQFVEVKAIAMSIAGVSATMDPEFERKLTERITAEADRKRREEAERDRLRAAMPATWESLDRRSLVGERYLASRDIDSRALRDVVRYTHAGDPALPLCDLASGDIVGIQHRRTDPTADPKC